MASVGIHESINGMAKLWCIVVVECMQQSQEAGAHVLYGPQEGSRFMATCRPFFVRQSTLYRSGLFLETADGIRMNKENIFTRLHQQLPRRLQPTRPPAPSPRRKPRSRSAVVHDVPPPSPMLHTPHATLEGDPNDPHTLLRGVFLFYCRFGRTCTSETTMDGTNFAKFCRECPSLIGARFANVDIDITFAKVKPKGERRISYALFLEALGMVALKRYPDLSLESALPRLLKVNIAMLPCVVDTQTGSPVKAVWRRRQLAPEQSDSMSDPGDPEMDANNDPYDLAKLPPPAPIPQRRRTVSCAPDL